MRTENTTKLAVFKGKHIRKVLHDGEWWFAVIAVVEVLIDSVNPKGYIKDMRRRNPEFAKGWGQIATPLSVQTSGGKQKFNCANTKYSITFTPLGLRLYTITPY
ncbi:MAG: hypothetical protein GQ533_08870 [Methanosarcinaceae archaeon]|nr:hypothetical protein [Methanosarcinaceae archaeon]